MQAAESLVDAFARLVVIGIPLLLGGFVMWLLMRQRLREREMEHAERMAALEKGSEIRDIGQPVRGRNPYTAPVVLIALALAILVGDTASWRVALFPLFAGLALVVAGVIHRLEMKRQDSEVGFPRNRKTGTGSN